MKTLLISTAIFAATALTASAQVTPPVTPTATVEDSLSGTVKNSIKVVLANTGTTSEAKLGVNGFGGGSTVVSNSGFNLRIAPVAFAASNGIEAGSATYGVIEIENERNVAVEGVMSGIGQVAGEGSTTTSFQATMNTSADGDNDSSVSGDTIVSVFGVDGTAILQGEATSEAGFSLTGTTAKWIGETGTEVGGSFNAQAGFLQYSSTDLYGADVSESLFYALGDALGGLGGGGILPLPTSFISLVTENSDIDLQIVNFAGGTTLLEGKNSDLFSGIAESDLDSEITLTGDSVCSLLDDSYGDICAEEVTPTPTDPLG